MQETNQDTNIELITPVSAEPTASATPERRLRGFAAMSPEKKREIASLGGRAAHACGRAHQFSSEEARAAGKKRHQRSDGPSA